VIFRRVQRGEVLEIGFDFRAVGDLEADRAEQRLDALQRPRDRMQATLFRRDPARSRRAILQPGAASSAMLPERFAAGVERRLDGFLGLLIARRRSCALRAGSFPSPSAVR
jgi:hypothetical protein